LKCVIECMCGGHHLVQCSCAKKGKFERNRTDLICKKIKVLPKCCQFHTDLPVQVHPHCVLDKRTGQIKERPSKVKKDA
jgi:hypothetical protein